ncbi:hypothetical protein H6P81_004260 [Aristolochia fimbriata]|uniref:soluble epoxide hydrolase n=1 Tax=Aristolochia fimbriata TaxID=158543 RepID=A0AAV7FHW7_ARIFI|nr:hypothetical protein H6P81_004260 [Aristolochia fimbriata]
MEGIEHRTLMVNGINMHIAEKGQGPAILFVHGFPELWYSWRHQIIGLAARGYRCIAPDMRGYGETDAPPAHTSYTVFHTVGDLVGLLDALGLEQVFVVGHDWGAHLAWSFCQFRPDRVKALVNLSVAYRPRHPTLTPLQAFKAAYGEDYYICRFQNPGEAEEEFSRISPATLMKMFLSSQKPRPFMLPKGIFGSVTEPTELPPWVTEEDINYFASKFEKTGFTGGFNYYRALDINWELSAPWAGMQIKVPVKFITGDLDPTYYMPGVQEYINGGGFKKDVPFLQDLVVMEGVGHFINQVKPEEINEHILDFIQKFSS